MATKTYTKADIDGAVADYAVFYGVETDEVKVAVQRDGDERVIGFCLYLDGKSRGCDEKHGAWGLR